MLKHLCRFFNNTGAVVGVFVVVGLASASIMMWILFAIRRRQRVKRIEQDTAVEAAVAAAGLNRAPLDDDDEDGSPTSSHTRRRFTSGMGQRRSLLGFGSSRYRSTSARLSEVLESTTMDSVRSHQGFENHTSSHSEEYAPAHTISSSPGPERRTGDLGSSRDRKSSYGHTPTYSAGSFEPLLANYVQNTPDQETSTSTLQPLQNRSPQHLGSGLVLNGYSSDGGPEDESRTSSKRQNSSDSSVLQDEELYTRGVLMASIHHILQRSALNLVSRFAMYLMIKVIIHYNECPTKGAVMLLVFEITLFFLTTLHLGTLLRYQRKAYSRASLLHYRVIHTYIILTVACWTLAWTYDSLNYNLSFGHHVFVSTWDRLIVPELLRPRITERLLYHATNVSIT